MTLGLKSHQTMNFLSYDDRDIIFNISPTYFSGFFGIYLLGFGNRCFTSIFKSKGLEIKMAVEGLRYPITLGSEPLSHFIKFTEFKREGREKPASPGKIINIYMPDKLRNPNTISWSPENLGVLGGIAENIINNADTLSSGGSIKNAANSVGSNAMQGLVVHGGMLIANKASTMLRGPSAESVFAHHQKGIPNPYLTMIFRGVNFRTFQFDFMLYPHSKKEAKEIDKIIKAFREASLPSKPDGNPYFLKYPNEFEIEYKYIDAMGGDKENKFLNKFKRCVITSINTDYTPTGMFSVMRDGFPSVISLSIGFSEIDLVLREDIENGY